MENLNLDLSKISNKLKDKSLEKVLEKIVNGSYGLPIRNIYGLLDTYNLRNYILSIFNKLPMKTVKVINLSNNPLPKYETVGAAGMDLRADFSRITPENPVVFKAGSGYFDFEKRMLRIDPMARVLIPTGLKVALPEGVEMQIRPRSGMALKKGLTVINTPGTVDEDYRGEVGVPVICLNPEPIWIEAGERICQAVFNEVEKVTWEEVDTLDETERGEGGFGHTGK